MVNRNLFLFLFKKLIDFSLLNIHRHLERARIVFAIENEMSTEERNLPTNKYWTLIDEERYLQVEEVDTECFRDNDDEDGGDENDNSKKLENDTDANED